MNRNEIPRGLRLVDTTPRARPANKVFEVFCRRCGTRLAVGGPARALVELARTNAARNPCCADWRDA